MPTSVNASTNNSSTFSAFPGFIQTLFDGVERYEDQNGRQAVIATNFTTDRGPRPLITELGFEPTRLADGTHVRWISDVKAFGDLESFPSIEHDWHHAFGGALFVNPATSTWGFIGSHGLGLVNTASHPGVWATEVAYPGDGFVRSLGGLMIFARDQFSPATIMEWVVAKMHAMTLKYLRIDRHLRAAGLPETGLGGGKGVIVYGDDKNAAIRTACNVLTFMGQHIGGNDEGNGEHEGPLFGEHAPNNFAGAQTAHESLRGEFPSPWTAKGVASAITQVVPVHEKGLLLGYGGVGSALAASLHGSGYRWAGIADTNPNAVFSAWEANLAERYFIIEPSATKQQDIRDTLLKKAAEIQEQNRRCLVEKRATQGRKSSTVPTEEAPTLNGDSTRKLNIEIIGSVGEIVEKLNGRFGFYSDNGPAHGITEDLAHALVKARVRYVMGAANNQAATPAVAGIFQRGGSFFATPHNINSIGATVVLSNLLRADESDLSRVVNITGEDVQREYQFSLQGKTPSYVIEGEDMRAWNRKVDNGTGIGGRFDIPAWAYRSTLEATIGKINPIGGALATPVWTLVHNLFTTGSWEEYSQTSAQMLGGVAAFMAGEQLFAAALGPIAIIAPVLMGAVMGAALDPKTYTAWDQGRYGDLGLNFLKHLAIEGVAGGLYSLANRGAFAGTAFGLSQLATARWTLTSPVLGSIVRNRALIAGLSTLVGLEAGYDVQDFARKHVLEPLQRMWM